jgi:putative transposase
MIGVLERLCSEVGWPAWIRFDQGREFISRDLDP